MTVACICKRQIQGFGLMLCCNGQQTKWYRSLKLGNEYLVHFPCSPQNACFTAVFNALVFISFSGFNTVLKNTALEAGYHMACLCQKFFFFFFSFLLFVPFLATWKIWIHRIVQVERDSEGPCGPNPCSKHGPSRAASSGLWPVVLLVTKDGGSNSDEVWGLGVLGTIFMRFITWMWAAVTYNQLSVPSSFLVILIFL